ncbi:MAG: hypothetical protein ACLRXC_08150 [[Clostridium] leptum]
METSPITGTAPPAVRHCYDKCGGNLGQTGCVSMFKQKKSAIEAGPG